jgi:hypothetical protein
MCCWSCPRDIVSACIVQGSAAGERPVRCHGYMTRCSHCAGADGLPWYHDDGKISDVLTRRTTRHLFIYLFIYLWLFNTLKHGGYYTYHQL